MPYEKYFNFLFFNFHPCLHFTLIEKLTSSKKLKIKRLSFVYFRFLFIVNSHVFLKFPSCTIWKMLNFLNVFQSINRSSHNTLESFAKHHKIKYNFLTKFLNPQMKCKSDPFLCKNIPVDVLPMFWSLNSKQSAVDFLKEPYQIVWLKQWQISVQKWRKWCS